MSLQEYTKKRDFKKTNEPEPKKKKTSDKPLFVVQKHDASRLHYDFRLEIGGVLKSWAIPKGPSTDPREKRLAVETEDHPLEYADFERVIPEGEYGAGTVLVWDTGTYRNIKKHKAQSKDGKDTGMSMEELYDKGQIEVWLEGEKIKGGYALVHTKMGGDKKNWLLIKMDDEEADARRNPVSTEPDSVKTGRSLDEIKEEESDGD